jgi:hypothetical protein
MSKIKTVQNLQDILALSRYCWGGTAYFERSALETIGLPSSVSISQQRRKKVESGLPIENLGASFIDDASLDPTSAHPGSSHQPCRASADDENIDV